MGKIGSNEWELYDISSNVEQDLFKGYITEFTDIAGIRIEYYIRDESIEMDDLYGESTNTSYMTPKETKIVYDVTEEPTMTTGFGINSEEQIQYALMPKFTFTRDVSGGYSPKPGDVIKTIWNNRVYEIADVDEEAHIFHLNKQIWSFILKPFRFSDQSQSIGNNVGPDDITQFNRDPSPELNPDTTTQPLTAYGDNKFIEEESDEIIDYDNSIYGNF